MIIVTNKIPREMVSFFDLPLKAQSDFDYIIDDEKHSYRFVSYKGNWYDTYDTQRISVSYGAPMGWEMVVKPESDFAKWHSVISESFFSGVLFRFCEDDNVIVGRYFS